jgi:hypothetical protein
MNVAVGVAELWLQAFVQLRALQRGDGRSYYSWFGRQEVVSLQKLVF